MLLGHRESPSLRIAYNVDNEGVSRNVFRRNIIVASQKEDHFRFDRNRLEVKAQLQSIDFALRAVEHIETVPAIGRVDKLVSLSNRTGSVENRVAVAAGQSIIADNHHGKLGCFEFFSCRVLSRGKFTQNSC